MLLEVLHLDIQRLMTDYNLDLEKASRLYALLTPPDSFYRRIWIKFAVPALAKGIIKLDKPNNIHTKRIRKMELWKSLSFLINCQQLEHMLI